MAEDNDGRFDLSRRKALLGLGGIGTAAALGGIGTTALYTDTENADLTVSAGTLDLLVDAEVVYSSVYDNGNTGPSENLVSIQEQNPSGDTLTISLNDVKPGDCFCIVFSVHLNGNPAWVWADCSVQEDMENDLTEPEEDHEVSLSDISDPDAEGELDTEMMAMSSIVTTASDNLSSCPSELDTAPRDLSKTVEDLATSGVLFFDGETGSTSTIEPLGSNTTRWIGFKVCLPPESGNLTQADSISISCTFNAEQARNNPEPTPKEDSAIGIQGTDSFRNPYVDESPSTSSGT